MLDIIIVDDELDAIHVLETLIKRNGRGQVKKSFSKVRDFLSYVEKESADLIFLDIDMPFMNGLDVAKIINEKMDTKIIFTTSHRGYAIEAFDLRAYHYFLKPINRKRLNKTLDELYLETAKESIEIKFYNRFELINDAKSISFRTKKTLELLAFFIYKKRCTKDTVLDNVFIGVDQEKAINLLYSTFYYMKKALKDNKIPIQVVYKNNYYDVQIGEVTIDYRDLNQLDLSVAIDKDNVSDWYNIFNNYKGDFLIKNSYQWSIAESVFLREKYNELYMKLRKYYYKNKKKLLDICLIAFKLDPTDDEFCYNLIYELQQQKKTDDAIQIFNTYKEECGKLSIEVSSEVEVLFREAI